MRPLFSQSSVAAVRLIIALVTAFAMMVLDVRVGALNDVRLVVKTLLVPIEAIASAPVGMFDWAQEVTRSRSSLELDREQLQLENEWLRIEQLELQSLQAENAELRRLLDVSQRQPARLLQGQVQSISTDPLYSSSHHQPRLQRRCGRGLSSAVSRGTGGPSDRGLSPRRGRVVDFRWPAPDSDSSAALSNTRDCPWYRTMGSAGNGQSSRDRRHSGWRYSGNIGVGWPLSARYSGCPRDWGDPVVGPAVCKGHR